MKLFWKTPENCYLVIWGGGEMYKKRCIIITKLVFRANLQFMSFRNLKKMQEITRVIAHARSLILSACLNVNYV